MNSYDGFKNRVGLKPYFCKMKWFFKFVDFIIYSSIWVALSVASLTKITAYNLGFEAENDLVFFVFFSTIIGYNFIKHYRPKKNLFKFQYSKTHFLNVISFCLVIFYFSQLKVQTQVMVIVPFLIVIFYTISFGNKTLRNISGTKINAIALSWVFVTSVLPIIENELVFNPDFYLECMQRFVFVAAITLPFEIRDLTLDETILGTIPQKFGIKYTKIYGLLLLMLFLLLEFFKDTIVPQNLIILPLIFLVSLLFVVLSKKSQQKYYASFFVEGIPILWLGLWIVL